ncbi:hypothetical protein HYQ45_015540 [Verticillium longisporum]|uniref:Uncharacterized protein n=1 Tax=Verticillium longisporum TaxID=100787 RepID=A0A8I2ZA45_VERLO|nr:hypothetical protein HYQ45_015540 [Verticillium longisporum]
MKPRGTGISFDVNRNFAFRAASSSGELRGMQQGQSNSAPCGVRHHSAGHLAIFSPGNGGGEWNCATRADNKSA